MPSELEDLPRTGVSWRGAVRIQPWHHPEADIWRHLVSEPDLGALLALLQHTEPDTYRSLGAVDRLEGWQIMRGDGAGWAMPAFTWGGPGRFNSERFGCFYAAQHLETAVAETVYHQQRLLREMRSGPRELRMRALRADTDAHPTDLRGLPADDPIYDPDGYASSQKLGAEAHQARADGFLYTSVRRPGYACLALYRSDRLLRCESAEALAYLWDGRRISVEQRTPISW